MLYFLLTIIAIWVLLASEAGQELLYLLLKLGIIGFVLYVIYYILLFGFFIVTDYWVEKTSAVIGYAIFIAVIGTWAYWLFNSIKTKKITIKQIKKNISEIKFNPKIFNSTTKIIFIFCSIVVVIQIVFLLSVKIFSL